MPFARVSDFLLTTPVRLTLGFLSLYVLGSVLIFGYLNHQLRATLTAQFDDVLKTQQSLLVLTYHEWGLAAVRQAIENDVTSKGGDNRTYQIIDRYGSPVFVSGNLVLPKLARFSGIKQYKVIVPPPTPDARPKTHTLRIISFALPKKMTAFIAINTQPAEKLMGGFWSAFLRTESLIVLLGVIVGLWLAQRFWAQVQGFNATVLRIANSGDLRSRMPVSGNDEFASLASNVNTMLERIEKLVQGIRQVSDNIAHDLRSPLTRLRADVEVALNESDASRQRETLLRVLEELHGMQIIFNSLLAIGRAEAGEMRLQRDAFDLSQLLDEMAELYGPSAEEHELVLETDIAANLKLNADRQILAQAFSNLLDNAIKYVPAGGVIRLSAKSVASSIEITVEDSGPGIPADMREKVFERFTRLDPSRTMVGAGLGLSLVKAFIELHGGTVTLRASDLGGAAFEIHLPGPSERQA